MLTRESILKADDLPRTEVAVPEWGGSVYVRALTGAQRVWVLDNLAALTGIEFVIMTCVDASGVRLFSDEDKEALEAKNGAALQRIAKAAMEFNFIGPDGVEEAGKD